MACLQVPGNVVGYMPPLVISLWGTTRKSDNINLRVLNQYRHRIIPYDILSQADYELGGRADKSRWLVGACVVNRAVIIRLLGAHRGLEYVSID